MKNIPKYFIVEFLEDVHLPQNEKTYKKGERVIAWEQEILNCYWTVNTMDNFNCRFAKKLYVFTGDEV